MADNQFRIATTMTAIFNHHCRHHSGADFEVCNHPACQAVTRIEARYGLEVYAPLGERLAVLVEDEDVKALEAL